MADTAPRNAIGSGTLRKGLATVAVLGAFASVGWLAWLLNDIGTRTSVTSIPYNEAIRKALDLRLAQSTSFAQLTTVLLAALGALWIAKGDSLQLSLRRSLKPEITMWVAGVAMLCAGLYCHTKYLENVANALHAGGLTSEGAAEPTVSEVAEVQPRVELRIPDIFDDKFEAFRTAQFWLLIFGTVAASVAMFSVRNLAEVHNAESNTDGGHGPVIHTGNSARRAEARPGAQGRGAADPQADARADPIAEPAAGPAAER